MCVKCDTVDVHSIICYGFDSKYRNPPIKPVFDILIPKIVFTGPFGHQYFLIDGAFRALVVISSWSNLVSLCRRRSKWRHVSIRLLSIYVSLSHFPYFIQQKFDGERAKKKNGEKKWINEYFHRKMFGWITIQFDCNQATVKDMAAVTDQMSLSHVWIPRRILFLIRQRKRYISFGLGSGRRVGENGEIAYFCYLSFLFKYRSLEEQW